MQKNWKFADFAMVLGIIIVFGVIMQWMWYVTIVDESVGNIAKNKVENRSREVVANKMHIGVWVGAFVVLLVIAFVVEKRIFNKLNK